MLISGKILRGLRARAEFLEGSARTAVTLRWLFDIRVDCSAFRADKKPDSEHGRHSVLTAETCIGRWH